MKLQDSLSLLLKIPQVRFEFQDLLKFVWLRLELLLHVAQLLDQGCEGDSPLGLLVPAPAHQLINLPTRKRGITLHKSGDFVCLMLNASKAIKCDAFGF